ncbi:NfeD family protein [Paracoccus tibetensis]|uniref:NfeD-like C-terminal, partner-binding n=1 Tax=Paracoccus tibetensis TaxID=336292 RepID=A0A1G5IKR1_9RHOB|nr:hypothetical protein [Paracoccus tibetensis]SCY76686.1 hypothetical protein SAMN05660710_02669 [Paracoccus tibetensis]
MSALNGWLWLVAALVIATIELLLPGWIFMGLAGAVGIMAVLLITGVWTASLPVTLVVTAVMSAVIWFALRRIAGPRSAGEKKIWTRDIND